MTISSSIEGQINPKIASQPKKTADAPTGERASPKAGESPLEAPAAETPAVLVDAASQQTQAGEKLASIEIGSAAEASSLAQRLGAALSQQSSSIANQSTVAVAGLLSELEAA